MMRNSIHIILSTLIILAAVMSTGCDHREIVCPAGEATPLKVAFSWDNAPDAHPEGMTLYFYAANGGCRRFDMSGRDGGRFELPIGHYDMIAVNNDLPGVSIENYEQYHSVSAVARPTGSGAAQETPSVRPTGMLYGGVVNDIEVTMCGVSYRRPDGTLKECPGGLIRCSPDSLAKVYHVIFLNVKGIDRISVAEGMISGMASELRLCDNMTGSGACRVAFPLDTVSGRSGELRGLTTGFGAPEHHTVSPSQFSLTIRTKLKNGKIYSKTYDVSRQVENFLQKNTIIIIIDDLEIPADPSEEVGDDGFDVGVSDWNTVEIEL